MPFTTAMDVVILEVEEDLSNEVATALGRSDAHLSAKPARTRDECIDSAQHGHPVVVCGLDVEQIRTVRDQCPAAPIIVVSRSADESAWLDALEAGADDYYAAPLDRTQIRWMVDALAARSARA
jgi:DNA-binding response OmpR family regulator